MRDLYIGLAISCVLFVAMFALGAVLGKRAHRRWAILLILFCVGGLLFHAFVLLDNVAMARLIPVSNLIIVGNLAVPIVGFLIGLSMYRLPRPWWRRAIFLVPLGVLCLYKAYSPIWTTPPLTSYRWSDFVCMQTSDSTCSAAACATLLWNCGIASSEREMAGLCLTSEKGTSMLGIYRGLKLKTAGTNWDVRPITGGLPDLREALRNGPVLISVGLRRGQQADPRYEKRWGWTPGTMHTVVVFHINPNNSAAVGDPKVGGERWEQDALITLWRGQGVQLVQRQPK